MINVIKVGKQMKYNCFDYRSLFVSFAMTNLPMHSSYETTSVKRVMPDTSQTLSIVHEVPERE